VSLRAALSPTPEARNFCQGFKSGALIAHMNKGIPSFILKNRLKRSTLLDDFSEKGINCCYTLVVDVWKFLVDDGKIPHVQCGYSGHGYINLCSYL
jgi:hypothetical protein